MIQEHAAHSSATTLTRLYWTDLFKKRKQACTHVEQEQLDDPLPHTLGASVDFRTCTDEDEYMELASEQRCGGSQGGSSQTPLVGTQKKTPLF